MKKKFNKNSLIIKLILIGIIRSLQLGKMTYDEAHMILLCPGGLANIQENDELRELYNVIERAMGLEDHFSLLGLEAYLKELVDIERDLTNSLTFGNYDQLHEVLRIITSIKSI